MAKRQQPADQPQLPGEVRPAGEVTGDKPLGLFGRLENFFKPLFGGAQVGPAQAPPTPARPEWVCDVCHQPARAHRFDASQRGRMYCPPPAPPGD